MSNYFLEFQLESDAAFGRGDGVAGVADAEVQHDDFGCPYLGGRALKGLLVQECADILAALPLAVRPRWKNAAARIFGRPGSALDEGAIMSIGNAQLPADLRQAVERDVRRDQIRRTQVLESLTALRVRTAMEESGVPKPGSLRTLRVALRGTRFEAALRFAQEPTEYDLALLAACVKAFRRAGTGVNRGTGRLKAHLLDPARERIEDRYFAKFRAEVTT
jgi:hypothetical protein